VRMSARLVADGRDEAGLDPQVGNLVDALRRVDDPAAHDPRDAHLVPSNESIVSPAPIAGEAVTAPQDRLQRAQGGAPPQGPAGLALPSDPCRPRSTTAPSAWPPRATARRLTSPW